MSAVYKHVTFLKQAIREVPKSGKKRMLRNQCVDAAGSSNFSKESATTQHNVTATMPNLSLGKSWITESLLINEEGIRVLYPRRQIAVL